MMVPSMDDRVGPVIRIQRCSFLSVLHEGGGAHVVAVPTSWEDDGIVH